MHIICKKESPGITRSHQERFLWVPLGSLWFLQLNIIDFTNHRPKMAAFSLKTFRLFVSKLCVLYEKQCNYIQLLHCIFISFWLCMYYIKCIILQCGLYLVFEVFLGVCLHCKSSGNKSGNVDTVSTEKNNSANI